MHLWQDVAAAGTGHQNSRNCSNDKAGVSQLYTVHHEHLLHFVDAGQYLFHGDHNCDSMSEMLSSKTYSDIILCTHWWPQVVCLT